MSEPLKNIRACADGKWQAFVNVRGTFFIGPKFDDADLAGLDADKVKFWLKGRGILRNTVTPNFPDMWAKWEANPEEAAPSLSPELETFMARFPADTVTRNVVTSSRRTAASKIGASIETLRNLLDESPSRLDADEPAQFKAVIATLRRLL